MRGYLNGVTAFAPHLINVCIREQDEIQTTKPQNLWTLLKINTDELTANLTKVKLNINSTHTPKKKVTEKFLATKYNGKCYGGFSQTWNKQELSVCC